MTHPDLAPFKLFSTGPESFSLLLTDDNMVAPMDVFRERGREGNGYGWHTVARTAIYLDAQHLETRVKFDPEAGMFCAHGPDEAALRELGLILLAAYQDHDKLARLIAGTDPAPTTETEDAV